MSLSQIVTITENLEAGAAPISFAVNNVSGFSVVNGGDESGNDLTLVCYPYKIVITYQLQESNGDELPSFWSMPMEAEESDFLTAPCPNLGGIAVRDFLSAAVATPLRALSFPELRLYPKEVNEDIVKAATDAVNAEIEQTKKDGEDAEQAVNAFYEPLIEAAKEAGNDALVAQLEAESQAKKDAISANTERTIQQIKSQAQKTSPQYVTEVGIISNVDISLYE